MSWGLVWGFLGSGAGKGECWVYHYQFFYLFFSFAYGIFLRVCVGWVYGEQHKSLFQSVRSGSVRVIDFFEHLPAGWLAGRGWEHGSRKSLLDIYCGQLVFVTTVSISPFFSFLEKYVVIFFHTTAWCMGCHSPSDIFDGGKLEIIVPYLLN